MEKYQIRLYDMRRASETEGVVLADEGESSDEIILTITVENHAVTAKADDYFSAYQELRDRLLKIGFGLKCNGSRINATQSAMMSYTPKVYLVEMGRQALRKDIVDIWGDCDITCFPDTEEQNQYIDTWRASLRT